MELGLIEEEDTIGPRDFLGCRLTDDGEVVSDLRLDQREKEEHHRLLAGAQVVQIQLELVRRVASLKRDPNVVLLREVDPLEREMGKQPSHHLGQRGKDQWHRGRIKRDPGIHGFVESVGDEGLASVLQPTEGVFDRRTALIDVARRATRVRNAQPLRYRDAVAGEDLRVASHRPAEPPSLNTLAADGAVRALIQDLSVRWLEHHASFLLQLPEKGGLPAAVGPADDHQGRDVEALRESKCLRVLDAEREGRHDQSEPSGRCSVSTRPARPRGLAESGSFTCWSASSPMP